MAGVIDSFSFILKKSFDLRLWLYLFIILVLAMIGFVALVFAGIFIGAILFVFLQFTALGLFIYFLLFLVFLVIAILFGAAINGTSLNLVRDYLERGKIDLSLAFNKAYPRIITSFQVELIAAVFFGIIFLLCFLPFIFSLLNLIESISLFSLAFSSPEQIISLFLPVLGSFFLGILLFSIFSLIIAPFTVIYKQIPFFESHGAIGSIRRAIFLGKKNYFSNLAFFVLIFIFIGIITLIYVLISVSLVALNAAQIAWMAIFAVLLRIVIEMVYTLWVTVFSFLFDTKIYLMNVEGEKKKSQAAKIKSKSFLAEKPFSKKPLAKPKPKRKKK